MVRTAIAFLLGCLLVAHLPRLPEINLWLWLMPIVLLCLYRRYFSLAIFIFAITFSGYEAQQRLADRLPHAQQQIDQLVTGKITSVPEVFSDHIRFIFSPNKTAGSLPTQIRLSWHLPPENLSLHAGETWQFTVRLKKPYSRHNPGTFDYEGWLFQNKIGATGYIKQGSSPLKLAEASPWSIDYWRQTVSQHLSDVLKDSQQMPLTQGLTVGLREGMTDDHWRILRQTGTSHLLAISGLHIGLSAILGFFIVRWLWSLNSRLLLLMPAQIVGSIGGLILAVFYALLAGMSIPTQRTIIMIACFTIALILRRKAMSYQVLAAALLFVLLLDPFAVLSIGMWLSFMAVAIILYLNESRYPPPKYMWLKIHLWIAVTLTPFLFLFFNETSLISPVANLIAVPVVSLIVVPLLLLGIVLFSFNDSWSIYPLYLAEYILDWLWQLLALLADLPYATWQTANLPFSYLALGFIGLVLLLAPKGFPHKFLGIFLLLPAITFSPPRPTSGDFWLTVLDVGQGLSVIVETENHLLVYDTGPKFGEFDTGKSVVVPYLKAKGHHRINKIIISHPDSDHIGGLESVLAHYPNTPILGSNITQLTGTEPCISGQSWRWDNVLFEIIHPEPTTIGSTNDTSCVLRVKNSAYRALLPGDIERTTEFELVRHHSKALAADILVVPHHGSRTSSTETFIEAVSPHYALFSAGYLSMFNHPASQIVERYHTRQITTFNTAEMGALTFRLNALGHIDFKSSRQTRQRLWSAHPTD